MTRKARAGEPLHPTHGTIKWRSTSAAGAAPHAAAEELANLLLRLSTWPQSDFAAVWWPGDYRVLELTCKRPVDLDAIVVCQSYAGSEFVQVSVAARVRSKAKYRPLNNSELEPLDKMGFRRAEDGRAELIHQCSDATDARFAEALLNGLGAAFQMGRGVTLTYRITQGSRLDEMPVFQDIALHELVSLLVASGHQIRIPESGVPLETQPTLVVLDDVPFIIRLLEPNETGFVTLQLETTFRADVSCEAVNELNAKLSYGTALKAEESLMMLRHNVGVTGGLSHAALRDRIDEWTGSLAQVAAFIQSQSHTMDVGSLQGEDSARHPGPC